MTDQSLSIQIKEKPKICAIDLEEGIIEALRAKGLQCDSGTLGSQVKVPNLKIGDTHQCMPNWHFPPNLHEYDIVIVDLQSQEPIDYKDSEHDRPFFKGSEQTVFLSSYPEKIFDPRPLSSGFLRRNLKDFFSLKTLLIIFCSKQEVLEYHPVTVNSNGSYEKNTIQCSLYDFIPLLLLENNKSGEKVTVSNIAENINIRDFLQKYSKHFNYEIVFEHPTDWSQNEEQSVNRNDFVPLLLNSINEIIGFIDFYLNTSIVLAFPQLRDKKKDFLLELIDEQLPGMFPEIFPESEQFSWLKSEKYFLPNQAAILERKAKLEDEYKLALMKIESEIQENKLNYNFLHDLITETGDSLVKAVENFCIWLEFQNIINMDERCPENKEEDLQILLENGLLVVEIKGIGGTSKDSECSQISKIKYRRARERKKI
ncbi:hypothetical protein QM565_30685 [Geitlerinema splendidum]|nr:hypothetical protein [Geitlerinema splendidum]